MRASIARVAEEAAWPLRVGIGSGLASLANLGSPASVFGVPVIASVVATVVIARSSGSTFRSCTFALLGSSIGALLCLAGSAVASALGGPSLAVTLVLVTLLVCATLSIRAPPLVHKFSALIILICHWRFFVRNNARLLFIARVLLSASAGCAASLLVTAPLPQLLLTRKVRQSIVPQIRKLANAILANLRCAVTALAKDDAGESFRRHVRADRLLHSMSGKIDELPDCKPAVGWEPTDLTVDDVEGLFRFWSAIHRSLCGLSTTTKFMSNYIIEQSLEGLGKEKKDPETRSDMAAVLESLNPTFVKVYTMLESKQHKIRDRRASELILDALDEVRLVNAYGEQMLRGTHFIEALHTHVFLLSDLESLLIKPRDEFLPEKEEIGKRSIIQSLLSRLPTTRVHYFLVTKIALALTLSGFVGVRTFGSGIWAALAVRLASSDVFSAMHEPFLNVSGECWLTRSLVDSQVVFVGISFEPTPGHTFQQSALRIQGTVTGALFAGLVVTLDMKMDAAEDSPGAVTYILLALFVALATPLRGTENEYGAIVASFTAYVVALSLGSADELSSNSTESYACARIRENVLGVLILLFFEMLFLRPSAYSLTRRGLAPVLHTLQNGIEHLYNENASNNAVLECNRSMRLQLQSLRHLVRSGSREPRLLWSTRFPRSLLDAIMRQADECRIIVALLRKTTERNDWEPLFFRNDVKDLRDALTSWLECLSIMLSDECLQPDHLSYEATQISTALQSLNTHFQERLHSLRTEFRDSGGNVDMHPRSVSLTISLVTIFLSRELEAKMQELGASIRKLTLRPEQVLVEDECCYKDEPEDERV
jgi:hypothetical protein